jgi:hypothetical protein
MTDQTSDRQDSLSQASSRTPCMYFTGAFYILGVKSQRRQTRGVLWGKLGRCSEQERMGATKNHFFVIIIIDIISSRPGAATGAAAAISSWKFLQAFLDRGCLGLGTGRGSSKATGARGSEHRGIPSLVYTTVTAKYSFGTGFFSSFVGRLLPGPVFISVMTLI